MKRQYIIAMIVGIVLMLWTASELFAQVEQKAVDQVEGFQSGSKITLNLCPPWAPQIQTAKGNTDCCEGELLDGKCNARTFCTLSPTHDGISTCIQAWKSYYDEKSKQCPSTMPNYFEEVKTKGGRKGCSASPPKEDGSSPTNLSLPRCVIYTTEKDNRERPDSCFVEKEKLNVRCPPFPGFGSRVETLLMKEGGVDKFGSYVCIYSNSLGQRNSCNDEKSLVAMWNRQDPNWRTNRGKQAQLEALSCRTFLDRERKKEQERLRLEAERRRADEERKKREAAESKLRDMRSMVDRIRRQAQEAAAQQKRKADQTIRELQNRLKR